MSDPVLSIVVIGRNEGPRLVRCLESLKQLRGLEGETEILYVDSGSTDGSPEIAVGFGARLVVLDAENLTAARARNAGWVGARAPLVLFLDGDTILHADFPRRALSAIALDDRMAAVWGHRREMHPEHSVYNRVLDLDWIYPPGETEFCGGDVLMRKSALDEVGGYDPFLIAGEEPELCRRLRGQGHRISHIDEPMTMHDLNMVRFSQYWKRAVRTGHAYAEISQRFHATSDPMWVRESIANFKRGGFLLFSFASSIALLARSFAPFAAWVAMLALLSARSAWKAKSKAPGKTSLLLLYGFHSQIQQVPILLGQLQYLQDRRAGRRRKLIEYKEKKIV